MGKISPFRTWENIAIHYIMNFKKLLKSVKPAEVVVLALFVLYLVFPVSTPMGVAPYIESPLGLLVMMCVAVGLFFYSHPALAILFLFVAYTLLCRSALVHNKAHYLQGTKSECEKKKDVQKQLSEASPKEEPRKAEPGAKQPVSLEEEIVAERAPIGRSDHVKFIQTSYKPVASNVSGAAEM